MLAPGARFGLYEIAGSLGAGGMGEVYRAIDTTLKRHVALKVLPPDVANNPERVARLQREAEILAALNHPNIAHLYGLEKSSGTLALAMELVEGPTLADRIEHGAIPLEEAQRIAKQIVEALVTAHDQGIVHRDLKPANIKVRDDGTVKVLDFGLAKLADPHSSSNPNLTMSPTLTSPAMTQAGVILGTAAYMAPEQARGRAVDKRADVWAFGCVLFEMLTGERPFKGEDLTETLAAIVKEQPDLTKAPREVQRLLTRCLEKDPRKRLRDLGDVWDLLDGSDASPRPAAVAAPVPNRVAWAVAALLAVTSIVLAFATFRRAPASAERWHLQVPVSTNGVTGFFAVSPDGRSVVMGYQGKLAVRSLETGDLRALTGTENGRAPFWSPDSRTIGFMSLNDRALKTILASGGVPQTLCRDVNSTGGGTWNREGTILFPSGTQLLRVNASGGACTAVMEMSAAEGAPAMPVFLPDADHFLYAQASGDGTQRGLYVASLKAPETKKRLLADFTSGLFAPDTPGSNRGRLLFVRELTLWAQSFDATSLQLSGDPVPVANNVNFNNSAPQIAASIADNGTLLYMPNTQIDRQMIWYDRSGVEVGRAASTGITNAALALSPDGKRVAFQRRDAFSVPSMWLQDLERNQEVRLNAPQGGFGPQVWAPDGQHLAMSGVQSANEQGLWVTNVGSGQLNLVLSVSQSTGQLNPSDWSRDGRWLFYTANDPKTGADVWMLPMRDGAASGKPVPLIQTPAVETQAQLSPDEKWLAYTAVEGGVRHVFVRSFADGSIGDAKWQVSDAKYPGSEPRWRADSKELFYASQLPDSPQSRRIVAVSFAGGANPVAPPRPLFSFQALGIVPQSNVFAYAPSADGQRFLVDAFASDARATLEIILNWAGTR